MVARRIESSPAAREVERAVRVTLSGQRVVLAISGGRDSMTLLHVAARVARRTVACVATLDHGTGAAARRAAAHVAREAATLGFPVVIGHARPGVQSSEAAWRAERHAFLWDVALRMDAVIATAHTRDDQVETILMRVLRDTGARGLAALYAPRPGYLRPLLGTSRAAVADYARAGGVGFVEDPANASIRFLRNRVRRDLLPALRAAQPGIEDALLELGRDAARWRARVDEMAGRIARSEGDGIVASAAALASLDRDALALLWPAIAARAGIAMDWRGTERAAEFTTIARPGSRMPLSGGWEITRTHDDFELRSSGAGTPLPMRQLRPETRFEGWRFVATRVPREVSNHWVARLPANASLRVRSWHPGDRMRFGGGFRRVKRFLSDARISGTRRGQWPVVLAGDEIVWIPGVRRSDAAAPSARPGWPGVWYRCELDDR